MVTFVLYLTVRHILFFYTCLFFFYLVMLTVNANCWFTGATVISAFSSVNVHVKRRICITELAELLPL